MTDKITAKDVAARAGVAASTVSRALNTPGRINEATTLRVLKAARELGYRSAERERRHGIIALLVPDVTNPFYFDIIRATQEQLRAAGFMQLLLDTGESGRAEADTIDQLSEIVDGVILTATRLEQDELMEIGQRLPLVVVNRRHQGLPGVLIDFRAGLRQAVEHLMALRHERIAFVAGPAKSWQSQSRWKEFELFARNAGAQPIALGPYPPTRASGAVAADALMMTEATACIAFNDLMAIGMLQRLQSRGVDVPGDISIVGCDDIFGADFCNPPLTTIAGDTEQAGRIAISKLLGLLNGRRPTEDMLTLLPTYLLVRQSTGPMAHL